MVHGLPNVSDVVTVLLAGFVVEDLVVNGVAPRLEAGHDAGVGRDTVAVLAGPEGFDEENFGVAMVGDIEVLVAAAGADREAACVVSVERYNRFDPEVELFRRFRWERVIDGGRRRVGLIVVCGLGGADTLLGLREVALDGFISGWAIIGGIGVGKAGPGGVVASFDGGEPGGLDGKGGSGVEVADEGDDAQEVVGVEGGQVRRVSGKDEWTGVGMIFGAERETP